MKPSLTKNKFLFSYLLLFIQPIFMATNIIVARGGVEYVPPVSLAFWRWLTVFLILSPFFFEEIFKKKKDFNKEFWKLFFLGSMGCLGSFPVYRRNVDYNGKYGNYLHLFTNLYYYFISSVVQR